MAARRILSLASLALRVFACGKESPGSTGVAWDGTWVSARQFNRRGSLHFEGAVGGGAITGQLTLDKGTTSQTSDAMSGEATLNIGPPECCSVLLASAEGRSRSPAGSSAR